MEKRCERSTAAATGKIGADFKCFTTSRRLTPSARGPSTTSSTGELKQLLAAVGSQSFHKPNIVSAQSAYFHEIHHLVHQQGWAVVWPEIFGNVAYSVDDGDDDDDDFADEIFGNGNDDIPQGDWDSSLICREVARLQCTNPGYTHSDNTCPCDDDYHRAPGDPAPSPLHGTCNTDDCDCVEFHRAAGLTYAGQYDPDTRTGLAVVLQL